MSCKNCRNCKGKCNKKGYPSVMKGSKYCQEQQGIITKDRINSYVGIKSIVNKIKKIRGFRNGKQIRKKQVSKLSTEKSKT